MMVVLTFHVGALTYFNTLKYSHALLHLSKAGSYKQPLATEVPISPMNYGKVALKIVD